MRKIFLLVLLLALSTGIGFAQCPNPGQNPSTALPVCGTAVFNQQNVGQCNGKTIPVPCNDGAQYTDVNPFYYKFTCIQSGPLEFKLTPNTITEDYDWELFDITNASPNDIFTNSSLVVACNWSGNTGTTGTVVGGSPLFACAGNFPLISQAPTLLAGHNYILMVSNFSATQSGYNLTFSTASASLITDLSFPKVDTVTSACGSQEIYIKLNKKIRCSSIASDGSDFAIQTNPAIANAIGFGCNTGNFDTDSIIVSLANPLPSGLYTFNIKSGSDGNTLLDFCDNAVSTTSNSFNVKMYKKPNADFTFTIKNETCKADTLIFSHDGNNGTTQWRWTFDGTPTNSTNQTQQVVYNSFNTRAVKLVVSNPICSDSITKNIPIADHILIPKIKATRDTTCPNNPETFSDISTGNIASRFWDFDNGQTSTLQNPVAQIYPVLPNNKFYATKLVLTNAIGCKDSVIKNIFVRGTIPTEFDSIIPPVCAATEVKIFFKQDMVCGSIALDGSDFSITGVAPNNIISASIACANGVGTVVTLQLRNPLITGNYQLTLKKGNDGNTVINDCGIETLPKSLSFIAFAHVNPTFSYTAKWGCKADTISFNHAANNNANNWQWFFADGSPNFSSSNLQNPVIIFSDVVNPHNVKLIVSNGTCFDTAQQSVTIIDHSVKAKYSFPDTTCGMGNTVFIDSSTGNIIKWFWNFGAGLTSNLAKPNPVNYPLSYNYVSYPTQLIVENITHCFDTSAIKNITVKPSSPALMDRVENDICSPDSLIVLFNSPMLCNTVAPDGSDFTITGPTNVGISGAYITNCNNNFGRTVVIKLTAPITTSGNYLLNLIKGSDGNTILNNCGVETAPSFQGFIAHPKVDANFTNTIKLNCKSDTLKLFHNGANEVNKWVWTVNGQVIGFSQNLTIPYKDSSIKDISLVVANATCKDTSSKMFPLYFDMIKAKFAVSDNIVCPTNTVDFTNNSTGNITTWKWDFGNRDTSASRTPIPQTYKLFTDKRNPYTGQPILPDDNFYTVTAYLIVGNSKPCYDTATQILKVTSNCLIQVPTAFSPNGDGLNDYLYPLNTYKASKFYFRVFNRAGTLIFESKTEGNKWNGNNYLRVKQPAGTYVWTLEYTDRDTGKDVFLKGTTVLIR